MDSEVSVADSKKYQKTKRLSAVKYARSKETHLRFNQVFKCLACVDTMRVINTKMLADKQRKFLDLKLFTNSNLFWGNTQLLNMPGYKKSDTPLKRPIPHWLKMLGYLSNWFESLFVSLGDVSKFTDCADSWTRSLVMLSF